MCVQLRTVLVCAVLLSTSTIASACVSTCAGPFLLDQAARALATEETYTEYEEDRKQLGYALLSKAAFRLDMQTALSGMVMMDDPTDGIFVSNVLNASPGEIVASDLNIVQHKCTTMPPMAGCPCKMKCDLVMLTTSCQLSSSLSCSSYLNLMPVMVNGLCAFLVTHVDA